MTRLYLFRPTDSAKPPEPLDCNDTRGTRLQLAFCEERGGQDLRLILMRTRTITKPSGNKLHLPPLVGLDLLLYRVSH
jgi:hypothetical protein